MALSLVEGDAGARPVLLEQEANKHDISARVRAFCPHEGVKMQNQFDPRTTTGGFDPAVSVGVPRAVRDAGLRSYMLKVYNYMASGVLLTGIVAMLFAGSSIGQSIMLGGGLLRWLIILRRWASCSR